jgi:hypothetical protein
LDASPLRPNTNIRSPDCALQPDEIIATGFLLSFSWRLLARRRLCLRAEGKGGERNYYSLASPGGCLRAEGKAGERSETDEGLFKKGLTKMQAAPQQSPVGAKHPKNFPGCFRSDYSRMLRPYGSSSVGLCSSTRRNRRELLRVMKNTLIRPTGTFPRGKVKS